MRADGIETFTYYSARSNKKGKNIAAFTPKVFHKNKNNFVFNLQTWQCVATEKNVIFADQQLNKINFTFENFATHGDLDLNPE